MSSSSIRQGIPAWIRADPKDDEFWIVNGFYSIWEVFFLHIYNYAVRSGWHLDRMMMVRSGWCLVHMMMVSSWIGMSLKWNLFWFLSSGCLASIDLDDNLGFLIAQYHCLLFIYEWIFLYLYSQDSYTCRSFSRTQSFNSFQRLTLVIYWPSFLRNWNVTSSSNHMHISSIHSLSSLCHYRLSLSLAVLSCFPQFFILYISCSH